MNPQKFLEAIQSHIGGNINSSENIKEVQKGRYLTYIPHSRIMESQGSLTSNFKEGLLKVDFITKGEILLTVYTIPPHCLLIKHENIFSKFLDRIHISSEVKIQVDSFDSNYIIQNVSEEKAKKTINSEFMYIIHNLEPFVYFEMTDRKYKLLKKVDIKEYSTIGKTIKDIQELLKIVNICKNIWRMR